jgi:hypothetical protein
MQDRSFARCSNSMNKPKQKLKVDQLVEDNYIDDDCLPDNGNDELISHDDYNETSKMDDFIENDEFH